MGGSSRRVGTRKREGETARETGRDSRREDVMKAKFRKSIKDEVTRVKCCCKVGLDAV